MTRWPLWICVAASAALAPATTSRTSSLGYDLAWDDARAGAAAAALPALSREVLLRAGTEPCAEGETACGLYFEQLRSMFRNRPPAVFATALGGLPVFSSDAALDLTSGWPAFSRPIAPDHVTYVPDGSAEACLCARTGAHLGHRIREGYFCINAAALVVLRPGDEVPGGAIPKSAARGPLPPALAAVLAPPLA